MPNLDFATAIWHIGGMEALHSITANRGAIPQRRAGRRVRRFHTFAAKREGHTRSGPSRSRFEKEDIVNQVTRLKAGMLAATNETIELNDVETDLEKARFDHQAKLFALQQEFNGKRDRLRQEYHERVQEITGEA
jgi:hypothetical protein